MSGRLIILRGNSGSGKSSVARELRMRMGYGTALIEQDYVRRVLLREKDAPGQPNIELIRVNAEFAFSHGYDVIIEGIMHAVRYGDMLRALLESHPGETHTYYLDVPFEETLRRHVTKPNAHEFGEELMRELYVPHDVLGVKNEIIIPASSLFEETVTRILNDINS